MKQKNSFFKQKLLRRDFLRWLGKATSALGAYSLFENGLMSKALASTTKSAQKGVSIEGERILLKNGLVIDGTGKKGISSASVLINGDKIEAVISGDVDFEGTVIDCSGKVIAPGIIDMHSHMDGVLPAFDRPDLATPFTQQGITTFVGGNCGFGPAGFKKGSQLINANSSNQDFYKTMERRIRGLYPLEWDSMDDYFSRLEQNGISHNLASLVGNGTTRASIQGFDATPMTGSRLKEQLYLLEEALEQGACGVSFGLQYEPDVFVTLDELKKVANAVKQKDKILTVHMKAYSALSGTYPLEFFGTPHNLLAIEDMLNIGRETGARIQLSHLIFVGERTWKSYDKAFEMIDEAISQGVDVKFDTYAYHCGTSNINVVLPEWFLAEIPEVFDSSWSLLKLRGELTLIKSLLGFGYEDIQITKANHPELEQFNGMFLKDIAEARDMGEFENFIDFVKKSRGIAAVLNHRYSNLEQVKAMISHPSSLFQTDALVNLEGVQNPASFGNFPRILQYARDFNLISLEEAVHKMTGASAERFGIKDRGILEANKAADILVFDWENIKDNNTDLKTSETPDGIEQVFINGQLVLNQGTVNSSLRPGVVLKS